MYFDWNLFCKIYIEITVKIKKNDENYQFNGTKKMLKNNLIELYPACRWIWRQYDSISCLHSTKYTIFFSYLKKFKFHYDDCV